MGIYYFAVDEGAKEKIEPPKGHPIKFPGIVHPMNPFSNMVVMKNALGSHFEIVNDMTYEEEGLKDITEQAYADFLRICSDAKEFYEGKTQP